MAISKEKKEQIIKEFEETFQKVKGITFVNFSGLSVEEISSLRNSLKEKEGKLKIIKNNLLEIIFQKLNKPLPEFVLEGATAVAFTFEDEIGLFKDIYNFARENKNLIIKGGVLEDGQIVDREEIFKLALLPSKKEIYSKLIYVLNSPQRKLIYLLKSPSLKLLYILKNHLEQIKV